MGKEIEKKTIKLYLEFYINAISDKDIWESNSKGNIRLFVITQLKKAMQDAYCSGFDEAEKVFKRIK